MTDGERGAAPMEEIRIETEYIRLDALLKLCGAVATGGQGKAAIQDGQVWVNGELCTMRGKKIRPGDSVQAAGRRFKVERCT